jgi:hypothetical protein
MNSNQSYSLCITSLDDCKQMASLQPQMSHQQVMDEVGKLAASHEYVLVKPAHALSNGNLHLWRPSEGISLEEAAGPTMRILAWPKDALGVRIVTADTKEDIIMLFWIGERVHQQVQQVWTNMEKEIRQKLPGLEAILKPDQSKGWFQKFLAFVDTTVSTILSNQLQLDEKNRDKLAAYLNKTGPVGEYPIMEVKIQKNFLGLINISSSGTRKFLQLMGIGVVFGGASVVVENTTGVNISPIV